VDDASAEENESSPYAKSTLAYKILMRLLKGHEVKQAVIEKPIDINRSQFRRDQLAPDFSVSSKSVRLLRTSYMVLKQ